MLNFPSDLWSLLSNPTVSKLDHLLSNPTANKKQIIQYLNTQDEFGRSFIASCEVKDFNKILLSLKDYPEILREVLMEKDEVGDSVLMQAIFLRRPDIVEAILSTLSDHRLDFILNQVLSQVDNKLYSPLHMAIRMKEPKKTIIVILSSLKYYPEILRAVLMQKNNDGDSVLIQAISLQKPIIVNDILLSLKDHSDILQEVLMQTNSAGNAPLHRALSLNNLETIKAILSSLETHPENLKKVLTQKNSNGNAILHHALLRGKFETVNNILSYLKTCPFVLSEVLMQKNIDGKTVLMQLISSQKPEFVNDILSSFKQKDNDGYSVLMQAIYQKNPEIVNNILSSLQVNQSILQEVLKQKDNYGRSVLNHAIIKGDLQIVEKILSLVDEQTRDIIFNELDINGDKALFEAMKMVIANDDCENTNREEILKLLVKNKFNIDLDQSQISALTSFYKNRALLGLMTQDTYRIGGPQNPHNLTKILNEVVASSESEDLRENPIAKIYAKEIIKVNSNQPILAPELAPDKQALYVYYANVLEHSSYVIFNVDQNTGILKSISYCDGNFYPELRDERPHLRDDRPHPYSLLPPTVYGVREFELKNEVKFSEEFERRFIRENFKDKDINSLQLPFSDGSQNIAIKGITRAVETRKQRRGNCSFKSANILARYLLQKQTGEDCSQDYQEFKKQLRSQVVQGLVQDYKKIKEQLGEQFVEHLGIEKRLKEVAKEKFGKKQPDLFKTALADLRLGQQEQSIKVSCFSCLRRVFSRTAPH